MADVHKLQEGEHVEVKHPTNGARVFVWNMGEVLRVSIISPVYPVLDVHADRVEVIEED